MSLTRALSSQPRWLILVESVLLLASVGLIDYRTGWEVSFFVFYAVPIFITVWCLGRVHGVAFAFAAAGIWWMANRSEHPYQTQWGYQIATVSRLSYFIFVAVGGAALKALRENDRERIAALEHTRELEGEIVRVSEDEQRRIGRDLHDGLCQYLAAINFSARSLADDLEHEHSSRAAAAREIEMLLRDAVSQARSLARGLFPVQMDGAGLSVALDEIAATTQRLTSVEVCFTEEGDTQVADPFVASQVYRIAQEALSNAMKHAGATRIDITLRRTADFLTLTVSDNGHGFTHPSTQGAGLGLSTMRYRARSIQSELEIRAGSSGGTSVVCKIPRDAITASSHTK